MRNSTVIKGRVRRARRGGFAVVYVVLGLAVFVGAAALGVDMSFLRYRKAQAQKAADAAALAGALNYNSDSMAEQKAAEFAALNGYNNGLNNQFGTSADGKVTVTGGKITGAAGRYRATVNRREPLFFAGILEGFIGRRDQRVGATAVAVAVEPQPFDITGPDTYGSATGMMNLSLFGRYGLYGNGDAYSTEFLENGSPNPRFNPDGYDFQIAIPPDYETRNSTSLMDLQIFDPDTYNATGNGNPHDAKRGYRVDELRNGVRGWNLNHETRTQYTLYTPNGTLVAQAIYGADSSTDMKWVTPAGFSIDLSRYPGVRSLRLNIKTLDGSSENGFNLRAGPPGATGEPGDSGDGGGGFNPNNGTSITATGRLPINFNEGGTVTVKLGTIPGTAAGGKLFIHKFDTDIQSQSISYTTTSMPGRTWPGVLSAHAQWTTDTIDLPTNYSTGTWSATYVAGQQDTSVWEMQATGTKPGSVYLVE